MRREICRVLDSIKAGYNNCFRKHIIKNENIIEFNIIERKGNTTLCYNIVE